jgi:tetratricopeptide (TPR) repeat protein
MFHTASATPHDVVAAPEYTRILITTGGSTLAALVEAARTHDGAFGFVTLNLKKLAYAWHGFESPNNVDLYLFRQAAPILEWLPATFVVLLPLAAVGVASRDGARRAWPVLVAITASVPTLILAAVLSRYRSAIAFALLPLAGAGVVRLAAWAAGRRWARLGAVATMAAAYLAWATSAPPGVPTAPRAERYAWQGVDAITTGHADLAVLCLRESLRLVPAAPKVEARLAQALLATGDAHGALRHVEAASRVFESAALRELNARVLATLGRREEALVHARAAVAAEPGRADARALVDRLEQEIGMRGRTP